MGRQYIEGFFDQEQNLETLLSIHLQSNHYPPVNLVFIPTCIEAIEACNNEDYEKILLMPNNKKMRVIDIIEGLHLDSFIESED